MKWGLLLDMNKIETFLEIFRAGAGKATLDYPGEAKRIEESKCFQVRFVQSHTEQKDTNSPNSPEVHWV